MKRRLLAVLDDLRFTVAGTGLVIVVAVIGMVLIANGWDRDIVRGFVVLVALVLFIVWCLRDMGRRERDVALVEPMPHACTDLYVWTDPDYLGVGARVLVCGGCGATFPAFESLRPTGGPR